MGFRVEDADYPVSVGRYRGVEMFDAAVMELCARKPLVSASTLREEAQEERRENHGRAAAAWAG